MSKQKLNGPNEAGMTASQADSQKVVGDISVSSRELFSLHNSYQSLDSASASASAQSAAQSDDFPLKSVPQAKDESSTETEDRSVYQPQVGIVVDGVTYIFGNDEDNILTGTDGPDQIIGGAGNDQADGGLGDDKMWGEDGNDTLVGGEGNDVIAGGLGDDQINAGLGDDTLWGEEGVDILNGEEGNDTIIGGADNDTIDGGADNDNIWGGEGQDQIAGGAGDDKIRGDADVDTIDGGDGNDTIWGDSYALDDAEHANDSILGGAGDDLIAGGGGNDTIDGGEGNDMVWGDEGGAYGTIHGNDTVRGGAGDDYVIGEGGNDLVYGDAGNDTLRGDASYLPASVHGNDELYGGDGDDKLLGGAGDDLLVGGTGSNEYQFSIGSGHDRITLTDGATDVIQMGTGITRAHLNFVRDYNPPANDPTKGYSDDFTIEFTNSSSSIFFEGLFALSYSTAIQEIRLADGTVILYDEFTNSAPVVAKPVGNLDTLEDSVFTYNVNTQGVFFDIDSDALTITLTSPESTQLFEWLSFDGTTLTGTPLNEHVGVYNITLTASDGYETVSDTFQLTVINTNDAPEVGQSIPNQTATEDSPFSFTFATATFFDVDVGDSLTFSAALAGGGALPSWLSFNAGSRTFSGTPENGDVGTIAVRVTATDTEGASVTTDFNLEVLNTNDTPVVTTPVGDVVANEDSAFTYTIPAGTFSDVDGDTLTYSATLVGGAALPAWLSFNGTTAVFTGTPANDDVGVIDIQVTATDGSGTSASDSFSLEVLNTNDAPVLSTSISDMSILEDSPYSYTIPAGTFTDVDAGDTLTYSATLSGGGALPSWLSLNSSTGAFSGTPLNDHVGVLNIVVTARDSAGATATDSFALTVTNTNDAPEVDAGITDVAAQENSPVSFVIPANAFKDVDGDALTYSVAQSDGSALPTWLSFNAGTRTLSGTPAAADIGSVTLRATASDGSLSATTDFTVTVGNVNDAPLVGTGLSDASTNEDAAYSFTIPAGAFTDPDGDTLSYTATLVGGGALPGWLSFNGTTGAFSGTPANADVGVVNIEVTATDPGGLNVKDSFALTVVNTNDAPVVSSTIGNQDITDAVAWSFQVPASTFSDPDGDSLTYSATLGDGSALPAWLAFDAGTRTFSGTPAAADEGTVLLVGVTDGEFSANTSFTLI